MVFLAFWGLDREIAEEKMKGYWAGIFPSASNDYGHYAQYPLKTPQLDEGSSEKTI